MADYKNINIRNKRATFDYEIIEEWIAGIVLVGTEIKSVRLGKASITDSYCYFDKGELWIRGVNIAEYGWGTCNNHVPRRDRKLLLNRKELNKIQRALQDRGLTVVGLRLFLNERGLAKVVVGLARGRKAYDKREYLKENDAKREMVGSFPLTTASNADIVGQLGSMGFYDLPLTYLDDFMSEVQDLTVEQVKAAMARHLDVDKLVIVTAGPSVAQKPLPPPTDKPAEQPAGPPEH